ncbi:MAG: YkgJ family cysteine cluster protein [Deltaproteobacteria bacterium]|nr:YkgJ family cysteine cluster protein [Deltaproteobacteria bacterium]
MSRLAEVTAKVDAFFTRVEQRHGDDMQCATGCSDCCHARLTVTGIEAAAIRAELATWDAARRAALAANAVAAPADHCAALDPEGRCMIYAARPVVCRSHGAPIRLQAGSLPVMPSCGKNFLRVTPDADCILDQGTLSTLVLAVDKLEGGDGTRIELSSLLGIE